MIIIDSHVGLLYQGSVPKGLVGVKHRKVNSLLFGWFRALTKTPIPEHSVLKITKNLRYSELQAMGHGM